MVAEDAPEAATAPGAARGAPAPRPATRRGRAPARDGGRGEARRGAILEAASALFADRPYDLLSIDEIAAEAGVAKGLIYYYFGSKRGLFLAVIENAAESLNALAEEFDGLSPTDRLIRTLDGFLGWAESHRSAFQTVTSGGVGVDTEVVGLYHRARRRLLAAMSYGLIGDVTPRPALRVALEGWLSFVEGAAVSWLGAHDLTREEVRDLSVRVLGGVLQAVGATDPDADRPAAPRDPPGPPAPPEPAGAG
ncbi:MULTISPECIES: TetR/AcrR family transcriptional regulator [Actinomadura]|uniref:TetR/AcrR family transcriptional regulator n=1 Tax=Actinomadura yumaensis TaxID=111807 RepID=A0ABW2CS35_9ACTN|nr:TetR/AcrR family transcriptional regulator [Actinomadura sp. J1-007]MWK37665.1 TetR family transcriptional regulator [Actinomadura sp. J1-007]